MWCVTFSASSVTGHDPAAAGVSHDLIPVRFSAQVGPAQRCVDDSAAEDVTNDDPHNFRQAGTVLAQARGYGQNCLVTRSSGRQARSARGRKMHVGHKRGCGRVPRQPATAPLFRVKRRW